VKLVEECVGIGELVRGEHVYRAIRYRVSRFQGMALSGLPVPGVYRIEGSVELDRVPNPAELVGSSLTLKLEDGRALPITLADTGGRVLAEGHGPKHGCSCC
jgi:hypothetical protein